MSRRAGLYLRISQDRLDEGLGVARQRQDCRALASDKGWHIADEYTDNDVSASSTKPRPEYQRMLADLRAGTINAVVVWDIDRLTRRPIEIEEFIDLVDDYGIALASVGGDVDIATDSGRLHLRIKAAVARDEVDKKSRRQRRQRLQAAESGKQVGGPRAYGYTADGMHLEPTEAPHVAEAYERFVGGDSLGSIARWLNSKGATTPRGYEWRKQSVRTVLSNPRNAGLRGVRRLLPGRAGRDGKRETWHTIVGDAAWPAIVDRTSWEVVMTILKDPRRGERHVGNQQRYLLSGLALCGVCSSKLITNRRDGVRTLKCPTHRHVSRKAEPVEQWVVAVAMAKFRDPAVTRILGLQRTGEGYDMAQDKARAEVLRARKKQLIEGFREARFDWTDVLQASESFDAELRDIDQRVAAATRVDHTFDLVGVEDPTEVWERWSLQVKRSVLMRWFVVTVLRGTPGQRPFDPASVRVEFRMPSTE